MQDDTPIPLEFQFPEKQCRSCGVIKPRSEFWHDSKVKSGLLANCKECVRLYKQRYRKTPVPVEGFRICTLCHVQKPISDFGRKKYGRDGLEPRCRECVRASNQTPEFKLWQQLKSDLIQRGVWFCGICKVEKPLDEFSVWIDRDGKTRYPNRCKVCAAAYSRKRYAARTDVQQKTKEAARKQLESGYLSEYQRRPEVKARMKPRQAIASHKRRAQKLAAGGTFTKEDVALMLKNQKGKCWYCGEDITEKRHIDHRVPLSRGGSNDPSNLVLTCPHCNLSKHDKLPHEWNGRLL